MRQRVVAFSLPWGTPCCIFPRTFRSPPRIRRRGHGRTIVRPPPCFLRTPRHLPHVVFQTNAGPPTRDAMKASRRLLLMVSLGLTCCLVLVVTTPAVAKTRPPIEAGDPDVGNTKPQDGPRGTMSFSTTQTWTIGPASTKATVDVWRIYSEYLMTSLLLWHR